MNALQFLQLVEATGLVNPQLLQELRGRIADTHQNMRPEALAKLLVDRGELTAPQARQLISDARQADAAEDASTDSASEPSPGESEPELTLLEEDADLLATTEPPALPDELELAHEPDIPEAELLQEDLLAEIPPETLPEDATVWTDHDDSDTTTGRSTHDRQAPPFPTAEAELPGKLDDPFSDAPIAAGSRIRRKKGFAAFWASLFGPKRPRKTSWDSPLILIGGGAILLLLFAVVAFLALFRGESASEMYELADSSYRSGNYVAASEAFEQFARSFPEDERGSLARVRAELALIRQQADTRKDWVAALAAAQQRLPAIQSEPGFADVRAELSSLLPTIAEGLVGQAQQATTLDEIQRFHDLAVQALELVNNSAYLPTSVRKSQEIRIEEIEANLQLVSIEIQRREALTETLASISSATDNGNIVDAYRLRDELLDQHPTLQGHPQLTAALQQVADQEREAVLVETASQAAETSDHPSRTQASIVLSDQRGKPAESLSGTLAALIRDAVYGVDAASGQARWRRFVGYETSVAPQPLDASDNSDVILVDGFHGEVQRVRSGDGSLVWRQTCKMPISAPLMIGDRILVRSGRGGESRLLELNAASGELVRTVNFPVGCTAPPSVSLSRQEIYQFGSHSSLYVLDARDLRCKQVVTTGHARESVAAAPAVIARTLLVTENVTSDASQVSTYVAAGEADPWLAAGYSKRLTGRVLTPLVVDDQRAVVHTDRGELLVVEATAETTAREIAARPSVNRVQPIAFALLDGSDLWIAGDELTRFELQATRGELVIKSVRHNDDQFVGPLARRGDVLIHLRRRGAMSGATLAATQIARGSDDGQPIWQTDLGVASSILIDGQQSVHAMTANGALFSIDANDVRRGVTTQQTDRLDERLLTSTLTDHLAVSDSRWIFSTAPPFREWLRVDVAAGKVRNIPLRIGSDRASSAPVIFEQGLLVACETGPIHWLDPDSGKPLTSPFLPRVEPGTGIDWVAPVSLGEQQFIAATRDGQLYRIQAVRKSLTLADEFQIENCSITAAAALDSQLFIALDPDGAEPEMRLLDGKTLQPQRTIPLAQPLQWGPQTIGRLVFAGDISGRVLAFAPNGELAFQIEPEASSGPLAGPPLSIGPDFVLAFQSGELRRIDASGNRVAGWDVQQPLGTAPFRFKGLLLVAGWDGTLLLVPELRKGVE